MLQENLSEKTSLSLSNILSPDYKRNTEHVQMYDNDRITMRTVATVLCMLHKIHVSGLIVDSIAI